MAIKKKTNSKNSKKPKEYIDALKLAEAGQKEEALTCIQEYLASSPNDAEALNDAGTLLYSLGFTEEALTHVSKARNLCPAEAVIAWNLAEIHLALDQPLEAIEVFEDLLKMGLLSADLLNRTADVCLKNNRPAEAKKMLQWSLELSPNQDILRPMIDVIQSKIAKPGTE